jgi:hypothetical protein
MKMDPKDLAQFASVAIMERPGMSSSDLGAALGRPQMTVQEIEGLHRYGRSFGFGQDATGAWFTVNDSSVIAAAYLEARRTPGAQAFFADDWDGAGALFKAEVDQVRALSRRARDLRGRSPREGTEGSYR